MEWTTVMTMDQIYGVYAYKEIQLLNIFSIFLDTWVILYFVLNFLPLKNEKYKSWSWILRLGTVWGLVVVAADLLSRNRYQWYYAAMIGVPVILTLRLCKGKNIMKIITPFYAYMITLTLDELGISIMFFVGLTSGMDYRTCVLLFILRRYGMRLPHILINVFLIKHRVKPEKEVPLFYWISLAVTTLIGNIILKGGNLMGFGSSEVLKLNMTVGVCFLFFVLYVFYLVNLLLVKEEENRTSLAIIQQNQMQKQYNQQIEQMTEKLSCLRHNFKEHLFCMDSLLANQEYDKLHEYLVGLHQIDSTGINITKYCENTSLNVILNQKDLMASKAGIRFDASVSLEEKGMIQQQDLDALVFNLLDNAIEAAARTENGFVSIDIHRVKAYLQIQVSNSVIEDVLKTNPEMKTRKRDKEFHGMGLKTVHKIVEKNEGIYQVYGDDHTFTTKVLLLDQQMEPLAT